MYMAKSDNISPRLPKVFLVKQLPNGVATTPS